ncbi:hypothetical protein UFOVP78_12 [uncultured Caudovirales phage]|uniref:Uncharacterized protein n=1 Tax=uncultured Caudovirales phage TaxID=2100421 RepID=A0A6J5KZN6_9CAUD|nr:hypothetical protein UFOVP78_12 [uncultured Caudovirales phage]
MAISKSLPFGNPADGWSLTYWRLVSVSTDVLNSTVSYSLAGYASAAARQAGGTPRETMTSFATLDALGAASPWEVTPAAIYAHAKRSTDPVTCTQAMVDAGQYGPELLGELVMPEAAPNPLADAKDA